MVQCTICNLLINNGTVLLKLTGKLCLAIVTYLGCPKSLGDNERSFLGQRVIHISAYEIGVSLAPIGGMQLQGITVKHLTWKTHNIFDWNVLWSVRGAEHRLPLLILLWFPSVKLFFYNVFIYKDLLAVLGILYIVGKKP